MPTFFKEHLTHLSIESFFHQYHPAIIFESIPFLSILDYNPKFVICKGCFLLFRIIRTWLSFSQDVIMKF